MKKLKYLLIPSLFILLSAKSFALTPLIDTSKFKMNLGTLLQNACEKKETNIETRIARFENNRERHGEVYVKLKDRLNQKIGIWAEAGYDVTKLEEDLKILDEKISNFIEDYNIYIDKLRDTQDYACGSSDGEFADKLQEARDALRTVREDARDIRNFYQTEVRKDILALKDQIIAEEE